MLFLFFSWISDLISLFLSSSIPIITHSNRWVVELMRIHSPRSERGLSQMTSPLSSHTQKHRKETKYRFPLLFAVDTLHHLERESWIRSYIKSPSWTGILSFWTMWIIEFSNKNTRFARASCNSQSKFMFLAFKWSLHSYFALISFILSNWITIR